MSLDFASVGAHVDASTAPGSDFSIMRSIFLCTDRVTVMRYVVPMVQCMANTHEAFVEDVYTELLRQVVSESSPAYRRQYVALLALVTCQSAVDFVRSHTHRETDQERLNRFVPYLRLEHMKFIERTTATGEPVKKVEDTAYLMLSDFVSAMRTAFLCYMFPGDAAR